MGWWFGRIMTFEVIADPSAPSVSSILADASAGIIAADASQTVIGYAAYGKSVGAAAQPLVDCFDVSLFDDGSELRPPADLDPVVIAPDELGNSGSGDKEPKLQREQLPVRALPSTLRLTYYDPGRDYQTGEARASAGENGTNEVQQDLPAVLSADDAKTVAQQVIARAWAGRDKLTLRLPPTRIAIEPGTIIEPGLAPGSWVAEKCTIDGFVVVAELRPSWQPTASVLGEAGRIIGNADVVEAPTTIALIDAPNALQPANGEPTILIAASSPNPSWTAQPLTINSSGQSFTVQAPVRRSVLGTTLTVLGNSEPFLIDEVNSVDVELIDAEQWIISCDDDGLADGLNLAVLGSELVQFGDVTPLGQGKFRLSHLLRGCGGTEWATAGHAAGEVFCLLDRSSVRELALPVWMRGSTITASNRAGSTSSLTFGAESVRPLAPTNLSAVLTAGGDLSVTWMRRSRGGFAWLDEVDAPVGESQEQYRVAIVGAAAELDLATVEPSVTVAASDLASLGSGAATVEVRQIGDWAASRPVQVTIELR